MEPTQAINLCENVLRDLVRLILGDGWKTHKSINLAKLAEKHAEDVARRRGSIVTPDLLAYTEFYHLKSIILDNWDAFVPALQKKKIIEVYLDRLEGFRNPVMHSRTLLPFERHLVEGIVGELRNLAAIYRTSKGPDMQYYPTITSVVESFGRTALGDQVAPDYANAIRVQVGEKVTFECHGTDPQGRQLSWSVHSGASGTTAVAKGADATLEYTFQREDVRESVTLWITMTSDNAEFHRHGDSDAATAFYYAVDPPN